MKKTLLFVALTAIGLAATAQSNVNSRRDALLDALKTAVPISDRTYKLDTSVMPVFSADKTVAGTQPMKAPVMKAAATTETYTKYVDMSSFGLNNSEQVNGKYINIVDDVHVLFETNTGTTIPAYYDLGSAIRLYNGNRITISGVESTTQISSVVFYFDSGNSWTSSPSVSSGIYSIGNQTWSGNINSFSIVSNAKVRLQALKITYTVATSSGNDDFKYIGTGAYRDGMFKEAMTWNANFFSSSNTDGLYSIEDPYGCEYSPYQYNVIYDGYSISSDMEFVIFNDNTVASLTFNTGLFELDDNDILYRYLLVSRAVFDMEYDGANSWPDDNSKYGIYENGVVTFEPGAMILLKAKYGDDTLKAYAFNSQFKFAMPGAEINQENETTDAIFVAGIGDGLSTTLTSSKQINKSADGTFTFDINNLEQLIFSTSKASATEFMAYSYGCNPIYGSTLGKNLELWHKQEYTYMPWKGNYNIVIDGDLSTIKVTTNTPRPSSINLYLSGDFSSWKYQSAYKFTRKASGEYTFTLPADIKGEWYISTDNQLYKYSYSGPVNPDGEYDLTYNGYNCALPLGKGDVLTIKFDEDIYTDDAKLTIVKAQTQTEQKPDETGSKEVTINNITYIVYPAAGTFAVSNGSKAKGNVTLLESQVVDGKTLTLSTINANAFADNNELNGIEIPDCVTSIGTKAFANCEYLQSIKLPKSLKTIGDYAFQNCSYLSEVIVPAQVNSIGTGAFSDCTDLTKLDIEETSIKEIPASFVSGCERLTEIEIPAGVTTISLGAFSNSGVTTIGSSDNVTTIADNAFANSKLAEFTFGSKLKSIGVGAFAGTSIRSAKLPAALTRLGAEAFKNCESLSEATIPTSISSIEASVFEGCVSLHVLDIPSNIKTIGDRALFGSGIVKAVIHDGVTSLGQSALASPSLMSVTIGSGITSLANQPISTTGMLKLNATNPPILNNQRLGCQPAIIIVPKGSGETYKKSTRWNEYNIVEENGQSYTVYVQEPGTLATDIRMQSGVMPAQVTNIVIVGELNETDFAVIRSNMTACYDLNLSRVTNTEIPDGAFKGKVSLTKVTLPTKIEKIGKEAFADCQLMEVASMPTTIKEIGESAFANCANLSGELKLSESCEVIGANAFTNCYALTSADLSKTKIKEIAEGTFANALSIRSVKLPSTVNKINDKAFFNTGISSINLPDRLKEIGESAFERCAVLPGISLPSAVGRVGARAFAESGVTYIDFPDALTEIEDEAMADCPNLMIVNLPSKLEKLGDRALASYSISAISSPSADPASTGAKPFDRVNNYTCGLSIPGRSFNKYLLAEHWGSFVGVRNNIDISVDEHINATYIDEDDYQEIIGGGTLNKAPARKSALQTLKANRAAATSTGYSRLFNGAQLYREDGSRTRFFFEVPSYVTKYNVYYNSVDVTSQVDKQTNSYLAPSFTASSSLQIIADPAGIIDVNADMQTDTDVYNLQGIKVATSTDNLPAGIYLVGGKKVAITR